MPDNIRVQADLTGIEASSNNAGSAANSLPTDSSQDITEIAQKLTVHGGRAASLDLAFDLVLHEIVEQARALSGATGAAIALTRDGKMVCRATSGENAPDLGVSVGAASGLTASCLKAGAIQHCQDTESDARVDPETCRRLGVRSMLLIPLVDAGGTFGVLQLFSSLANGFGEQGLSPILRLAERVAENRRALLHSAKAALNPHSAQVSLSDHLQPKRSNDPQSSSRSEDFRSEVPTTKNDLGTVVLFLLVIVAAISLGIVVGWSNGRKSGAAPRATAQSDAAVLSGTPRQTRLSAQDSASDSTSNGSPSSSVTGEANSSPVPAGGLLVTENGNVIYRSPDGTSKQSPNRLSLTRGARQLIHQVKPNYPPEAQAQHIEGPVILDVEIAEDGSVKNATVISGNPQLASAAIQAVKQWRYHPDPGGISRSRIKLQFNLPAQ
jgi:TonB family protein